jgi:hypothetical protein
VGTENGGTRKKRPRQKQSTVVALLLAEQFHTSQTINNFFNLQSFDCTVSLLARGSWIVILMVKIQRKPSGNTNANGTSSRPGTTGGLGLSSSNFSQPLKLKKRTNIFSDTGPDPTNKEILHRTVEHRESATWMIKKNDKLKYTTENLEKFEDPKKKTSQLVVKHEGFETSRNKMRSKAADKFFKLAKSRYGGAEDLFRAVSGW